MVVRITARSLVMNVYPNRFVLSIAPAIGMMGRPPAKAQKKLFRRDPALGRNLLTGRTHLIIALVNVLLANLDPHPPPDPLNHLRRYFAGRLPRFFGLGYRRRPPGHF